MKNKKRRPTGRLFACGKSHIVLWVLTNVVLSGYNGKDIVKGSEGKSNLELTGQRAPFGESGHGKGG
jgi:hypothetical protein